MTWPCTIPAPQLLRQGEGFWRSGGEIPWKAAMESRPPSGKFLLGLPAAQRKAGRKNSPDELFLTGKKKKKNPKKLQRFAKTARQLLSALPARCLLALTQVLPQMGSHPLSHKRAQH